MSSSFCPKCGFHRDACYCGGVMPTYFKPAPGMLTVQDLLSLNPMKHKTSQCDPGGRYAERWEK